MKPKKFRKRYIVLIVLAVLLIALAALAYWQRENIKAVMDFASYSQEELEDQLKQNDQAIKDAVKDVPEVTIRDVTEEERQALKDGTLSQEELVDRLLGNETPAPEEPEPTQTPAVSEPPQISAVPEQTPTPSTVPTPEPTPTPTPSPTPEPTPTPEKSDYEKRLSELIARVYVLREEYLLALEHMEEEAKALYVSLTPADRTLKKLAPVVQEYLDEAIQLEAECDAKMDAVAAELTALQKEYGKSMELVETVKYTYANEKSLKKAWYMAELRKRGLI